LLALVGARHFVHFSRIRVKSEVRTGSVTVGGNGSYKVTAHPYVLRYGKGTWTWTNKNKIKFVRNMEGKKAELRGLETERIGKI
jgi:hypothetical protein